MIYKQIAFVDDPEIGETGGIGVFDDSEFLGVICGCCGGFIEAEDVLSYRIYSDWMNISEEIMGE
jgi:hypothetical protein